MDEAKLPAWSRIDLLDSLRALTPPQLVEKQPGERWSIAGILGCVGWAEWWYLERLGTAIERADVPAEPFERLTMVRARLEQVLPQLIGAQQVVGRDGELWSPRKAYLVKHSTPHVYAV